jgi:hypothetical protein
VVELGEAAAQQRRQGSQHLVVGEAAAVEHVVHPIRDLESQQHFLGQRVQHAGQLLPGHQQCHPGVRRRQLLDQAPPLQRLASTLAQQGAGRALDADLAVCPDGREGEVSPIPGEETVEGLLAGDPADGGVDHVSLAKHDVAALPPSHRAPGQHDAAGLPVHVKELDQLGEGELRQLALDAADRLRRLGGLRAALEQQRFQEVHDRVRIRVARNHTPCTSLRRPRPLVPDEEDAHLLRAGVRAQDLGQPLALDEGEVQLSDHRHRKLCKRQLEGAGPVGRELHLDAALAAGRRDALPARGIAVRDQHVVAKSLGAHVITGSRSSRWRRKARYSARPGSSLWNRARPSEPAFSSQTSR